MTYQRMEKYTSLLLEGRNQNDCLIHFMDINENSMAINEFGDSDMEEEETQNKNLNYELEHSLSKNITL